MTAVRLRLEDSAQEVARGYRRTAKVDQPVIGPWLGLSGKLIEANRDLSRKQRWTLEGMWEILCGKAFAAGYTTVKDAVGEARGSGSRPRDP